MATYPAVHEDTGRRKGDCGAEPHIERATPPQPAARADKQKGAALVEAAITIPLLLLIAVGIFEFGRAYQYWQVLTNAAREGARQSVTPYATVDEVKTTVVTYMTGGGLPDCDATCVSVNRGVPLTSGTASTVTIDYPFSFMVLQPIAQLVAGGNGVNNSLIMSATATMRNESP